MTKPLLLMILDGWGIREDTKGNAIRLAKTPNYDWLVNSFPISKIDASGPAVGLPEGVIGNSEVGHLNIGSGRIASVGLTRIFQAIYDGDFIKNSVLRSVMEKVFEKQSSLHLMGLLSDGGVHSHQEHLYALLKMAKAQGLEKVFVHVITDGRDTPPQSSLDYIRHLIAKMKEIGIGKIATISGRFYTMDRDQRWERIQTAYEALVLGKGNHADDSLEAVKSAYKDGQGDEFIKPIVMVEGGRPVAFLENEDGFLFFNFRSDRARQITRALTFEDFDSFPREKFPRLCDFVCMMEYDRSFPLKVAFSPLKMENIFPQILSKQGLKQLRIAETEKYAHVTFFFNGGQEDVFPGEERILIPSPKEVPTYDLKPEMSALEVTQSLLHQIGQERFDVYIVNFANPDMVGHTGVLEAAIKAVETVDHCIGKICKAIWKQNGCVVLCADHGNCEQEIDDQGQPHTAHTLNLVPFIVAGKMFENKKLRPLGRLSDIAPTLLEILEIPKPTEMTGQSMFSD